MYGNIRYIMSLGGDEAYCLVCKTARFVSGATVECNSKGTLQLSGFCPACFTKLNKFLPPSRSVLPTVVPIPASASHGAGAAATAGRAPSKAKPKPKPKRNEKPYDAPDSKKKRGEQDMYIDRELALDTYIYIYIYN